MPKELPSFDLLEHAATAQGLITTTKSAREAMHSDALVIAESNEILGGCAGIYLSVIRDLLFHITLFQLNVFITNNIIQLDWIIQLDCCLLLRTHHCDSTCGCAGGRPAIYLVL
eukprot:SAG31_NODE_3178_length_4584_cov_7.885842_1_plen_114_part_00